MEWSFPTFLSDSSDLHGLHLNFLYPPKLYSGPRRNFEEGCQDIRQLLVTPYPGERQFTSPHAENVVYLALEVMQCV